MRKFKKIQRVKLLWLFLLLVGFIKTFSNAETFVDPTYDMASNGATITSNINRASGIFTFNQLNASFVGTTPAEDILVYDGTELKAAYPLQRIFVRSTQGYVTIGYYNFSGSWKIPAGSNIKIGRRYSPANPNYNSTYVYFVGEYGVVSIPPEIISASIDVQKYNLKATFKLTAKDTDGDYVKNTKVVLYKEGTFYQEYNLAYRSGDYLTGAYFEDTINLPSGNYEYEYKVQDKYSDIIVTSARASFKLDNLPTLTSNIARYNSATEEITLEILYTDLDGDGPVNIGAYAIGTSEFLLLSKVSGDYKTGTLYRGTKKVSKESGTYTYYFECDYDGNILRTGIFNNLVINKAPNLGWNNSSQFGNGSRGVDLLLGLDSANYVFSIVYKDDAGEVPQNNFPKVHIKKRGYSYEIENSPFLMTYKEGSFVAGAVYQYATKLSAGKYDYWFETRDNSNQGTNFNSAEQTNPQTGSFVSYTPQLISHGTIYNAEMHTGIFNVTVKDTDSEIAMPIKLVVYDINDIEVGTYDMNYTSGQHATGALYEKTVDLALNRTYKYKFIFTDNETNANIETAIFNSPLDTVPSLTEGGVAYNGNTKKINAYVKVTDLEGDAPNNLNVEIIGTNIVINLEKISGDYKTGAIYQKEIMADAIGLESGKNYNYIFKMDYYGKELKSNEYNGLIINCSPVLSWINEEEFGFGKKGVNGVVFTDFNDCKFAIQYQDGDNEAPKQGFPKVHILKNNEEISGSPFSLNFKNGDYITGAKYEYSTKLSKGQYFYYFEAFDSLNNPTLTSSKEQTQVSDLKTFSIKQNPKINVVDIIRKDKTFEFLINYQSSDNIGWQTGYPILSIYQANQEITSVILNYVKGTLQDGILLKKEINLIDLANFKNLSYSIKAETDLGLISIDNIPIVIPIDKDIKSLNIQNEQTVADSNIILKWSDVGDILFGNITYKLYLIKNSNNTFSMNSNTTRTLQSNTLLAESIQSPLNLEYIGTKPEYVLTGLDMANQYFWKVVAMNETGATKESEVFSFKTLDIDSKLVKPVPNPFSPYREGTDIVFKIKTPQTVKIKIYSEFGDLEYQKEYFANSGMNNFHYDGKDNSGRVLYNGSHICRIETKEGVKTCYLAVVK